jgi:hypothetical protein
VKRVVPSFAVALAGASLLLGTAAAAKNAPTWSKSFTFHLVEKSVGFNFVDNPPRQGMQEPPLIGDQFAFTSDVLTRAGKHAGEIDATCVVTRGGPAGRSVCTGIMGLAGGQLSLVAEAPIADVTGSTSIAIVGGTGAYEGATGQILSKSRGANSPFSDDTVHLILR